MNMGEIRMAGQADSEGICNTIALVWPDNAIRVDRVKYVLSDTVHATTVSVNEGDVVGFADGFLTTSEDGMKRWELDLLAVKPDFQRRGMASELIAANTQIGQLRGAEMARGLVAIDNVGSQRAFARCGYETDDVICELLVAFKLQATKPIIVLNRMSGFIQVNTINYSGLWIEGRRTRNRLEDALRQLASSQDDLVGMVVPMHEKIAQEAISLGFERVGRYQWWQRPLIND